MRVADAPLIAPYALVAEQIQAESPGELGLFVEQKPRNKPRVALHRRGVFGVSRISNSHGFAFSRRTASEACQSLANRARRWSGGRRQGTNGDP
jgi:hypothetical protein